MIYYLLYNTPNKYDIYVCMYVWATRGGGSTPYNGQYGEAPPERGTFFRLQVYKRVEISLVELYERVGCV